MRALIWFRQDLRLADNPALRAVLDAEVLLPLYIDDPEPQWQPGGAAKVWLHHSLKALESALKQRDSGLRFSRGPALKRLKQWITAYDIDTVVWNRVYEPALIERDTEIKATLKELGLKVMSFNAALLFEPWEIESKSGGPYQVFTPFWRRCQVQDVPDVLPKARKLPPLPRSSESVPQLELSELEFLPSIDWHQGIEQAWEIGENAAQRKLKDFLAAQVQEYHQSRDIPSESGTSLLSPHLHWGEISPRQIWHAARELASSEGKRVFLSEIGWREFAYHVLYHFPKTPTQPLREKYQDFPWESDAAALKRWQRGQTGYPIVDAGMRQLWETGWMHNRVRMIVASFLTKHLLIHWCEGAQWFWDTLVDADLASNTLGWQWAGGCGADAAPYFRIFNPMTQSEKFDPQGEYLRRWVPELAKLPNKWIHKPWQSPEKIREEVGFELGRDYPEPLVDHQEARQRALAALKQLQNASDD